MTTFKTLIRKSDGQWVEFDFSTIHSVKHPAETVLTKIPKVPTGSYIKWSLYEIVEVLVIRKDAIPTDEAISKEIEARFTDEYVKQEVYKLCDKLKRQMLGELIGHKH